MSAGAVGVRLDGALAEAERRLSDAGIATPRVDAELLAGHVLGLSRTELRLGRGRRLTPRERAALDALVDRRARREPLAYVLGEWGFRRLTLAVDRRVLVPRPETEVVVERCLDLIRGLDRPDVLDVGSGSGAIALAIADEHRGARVVAIDVSPDALEVARENAAAAGLDVTFEQHDVLAGLDGRYDLVVSNPPYVSADEIEGLEPEVRDWEPRLATVGDGHTRAVAEAAAGVLASGGHVVLEVADDGAERTCGLLAAIGYSDVRSTPDLTGRDRAVEGRWSNGR